MTYSIRCILLLLSLTAAVAQTPGSSIPATGKEVPALASYENALRVIMDRWSVPGAAFAITDGSRLVYARGLGYADREAGTLVQPTSRFRLASISKTIIFSSSHPAHPSIPYQHARPPIDPIPSSPNLHSGHYPLIIDGV